MEKYLIIISTTLIPAIITLIGVIFKYLTKYKKEVIYALKGTEQLQKDLKILNNKLIAITIEKEQLEKEKMKLLARISELERKVEILEHKKGEH